MRQLYNQVPESVRASWSPLEIGCQRSENQLQTEGLGPQWPTVEQPSQDARGVLLWSEELGSICSSLSPSPTHLSHMASINPFENKVWEIYFYKEVCLFIHWGRHYCWLYFRIYLYMYMAIQHVYLKMVGEWIDWNLVETTKATQRMSSIVWTTLGIIMTLHKIIKVVRLI